MARRSGGLDPAQVAALAARLTEGGRPRVRVSGPQFAPGTTGTVVRVGDPSVDGDDYLTVRTRVGGVVDELAFAPGELTLATRGAPVPADPPATKKARRPKSAPDLAAAASSTRPPEAAAQPSSQPASRKKPQPVRRASASVPIKIGIVLAGASWSVSVERGARALVKKTSVTPGVVRAIADLLGDPALSAAVADVNDAARSEAEARAEKLRAELAEVQAVLDSHDRPSRPELAVDL